MPFSFKERRKLSAETGGFCANPECRAMTGALGTADDSTAGEGAHIVAESPLGPRGQSPLTHEERNMASNGVWLCPTCHTKVDTVRPGDYSIELLQKWKVDAQIWWRQNQGKQLQAAALPAIRQTVARPSADSLQGAKRFLEIHSPLAQQLWNLRRQSPKLFEHDIVVTDDVETNILRMSSRPLIEIIHWTNEWATTYRCDDQELLNCMQELIRRADNIQRPRLVMTELRRVNFKEPDELTRAILDYLNAWSMLNELIQKYERYGISSSTYS